MMKDFCRQKESITQPVQRAWGDDPATRHHEPLFCHHHQSSPKNVPMEIGIKWVLSLLNSLGRCRYVFFPC